MNRSLKPANASTTSRRGNTYDDKDPRKKQRVSHDRSQSRSRQSTQSRGACPGCGASTCTSFPCAMSWHPDYNWNQTVAWADTSQGRHFRSIRWNKLPKKFDRNGNQVSPPSKGSPSPTTQGRSPRPSSASSSSTTAQQAPRETISGSSTTGSRTPSPKKKGDQKGKDKKGKLSRILATTNSVAANNDVIACTLYADDGSTRILRNCILDSGSMGDDHCYLSEELASWLSSHDTPSCACPKNMEICGATRSTTCYACISGFQNITVDLHTELASKTLLTVNLNVIVINIDFDLILSREIIKRYRLVDYYPSHFYRTVDTPRVNRINVVSFQDEINTEGDDSQDAPNTKKPRIVEYTKEEWLGVPEVQPDYIREEQTMHDMLVCTEKITREEDTIDINGVKIALIPEDELLQLVHIDPSNPRLASLLRQLVCDYRDIFSVGLREVPASLPPMQLQVDDEAWIRTRPKRRPRRCTEAQRQELEKQLNDLMESDNIRESNEHENSPSFFVPKPDHTWRFVVDYRMLNECTTKLGWPLPNIKDVLDRIGTKRPRYFGVMDLTKGYYQILMHENSRKYTAISTPFGVYEWNRIPMGLSGAPSYFQKQLATLVLRGLVQQNVEIYIDDVITHAAKVEEFVTSLRKVFERLRQYRVTLNPKKCRFGVPEVKYLGHKLSHDGVEMCDERKQQVIDFPQPQIAKELKSFLGVVNYFRDHVRKHSFRTRLMQAMLAGYQKNKKLTWTIDAVNEFKDIKQAIAECPKLYFVDDTLPIYVHTDASDYGVGAYVFQQLESGKEVPIRFLSKSLSREELRWSVPEKETYAIFWALIELEYLLRDRIFVLRTDHSNLQYINQNPSAKVTRWKLALQEYQFTLQHIPGKDNVIADAFSRDTTNVVEGQRLKDEQKMLNRIVTTQKILTTYTTVHYEFIRHFHNVQQGHGGVEATLYRMNRYFRALKNKTEPHVNLPKEDQHFSSPWLYMRLHVKQFIKECPTCQKLDQLSPKVQAKPFTTASYAWPMEELNVDTIGPLPESVEGYKHILVIIDRMSRYVNIFPIKTTESREAVQCLLKHVSIFRKPKVLRSDGGSQFANQLLEELLRLFRTEYEKTLAYSKEENAIVERANKTVVHHLRAFMQDPIMGQNWPDYLPMVQRIMNTSVHTSHKFTPTHLVFGARLEEERDAGLCVPVSDYSKDEIPTRHILNKDVNAWLETMRSVQERIIQLAQANQRDLDAKHLEARGAELAPTEFPVGSYVLVRYPKTAMGRKAPSKLHSPWKGPMKVLSINGNRYTLLNLVTMKDEQAHVTSLKKFEYNKDRVDPRQVAMKEANVFDVEKIIEHRCKNPKRISTYEFRVRWMGYNEADDTWEPWSELRDNEFLHKYLQDHNLQRFIPKKFNA